MSEAPPHRRLEGEQVGGLEAAKALAAASWATAALMAHSESDSEEEDVERENAGMVRRSSPPWKWRHAEIGSKRISKAPRRLSPPHRQVQVNQPHAIGQGIGLSANQRHFTEFQRQYLLQHFQFVCSDPFGQ